MAKGLCPGKALQMKTEFGYQAGDKLAYREYLIGKYRGDGWWIERDGVTISHYCGSIDIAKRIIDGLID